MAIYLDSASRAPTLPGRTNEPSIGAGSGK